ncbi:MAG: glutamate-5-semialdehyde dehydrogenase [Saprospiraceae bacterium]
MLQTATLASEIVTALKRVNRASRKLVQLTDDNIASIINELADLTLQNADYILTENAKDLERMERTNPKYDRLLLSKERLDGIVADLRKVASLPSPLNKNLEKRTLENGLELERVSVPLGVIGIVFESRPNVTFDVFALCLKSGNASVLKGSRDAHFSNLAIVDLIQQVLRKRDLQDVCYLAPSEREALAHILQADEYVNTIIPRGSQGLINYVRANSKVPVIETGAGIVHTYFDKSGDVEKGQRIVENAKTRRVSVCNALDTLVIHETRLVDLPFLLKNLDSQHGCEVYADAPSYAILKDTYDNKLLHLATDEDFGTEFLSMKMSVKTVADIEEALDHIANHSSKHSETIVAEDKATIEYYLKTVDAAVVYANASTGFTDGSQFGMGAEIGISTQKLHARGPMALRELTSYKWIVRGNGQIRS